MVNAKLVVEGGGPGQLAVEVRRAFKALLEKAGASGRLPRVIAAGGRDAAFKTFESLLLGGESATLLVDSEDPVTTPDPWDHVLARDKWTRPATAGAEHLHLMVRSMEAWLLRDPRTLAEYYGNGFKPNQLPKGAPENIERHETPKILHRAALETRKSGYEKGRDSFRILELLNPTLLHGEAWAKRFIDFMTG